MHIYEGQQVADQWYSEVERYNFKTHSGPKTGLHCSHVPYSVSIVVFFP